MPSHVTGISVVIVRLLMLSKELLIYVTYVTAFVAAGAAALVGIRSTRGLGIAATGGILVALLSALLHPLIPAELAVSASTLGAIVVSGGVIGSVIRQLGEARHRQLQPTAPAVRPPASKKLTGTAQPASANGEVAPAMSALGRASIALILLGGAWLFCGQAGGRFGRGEGLALYPVAVAIFLTGLGVHVSPWTLRQAGIPLVLAGVGAFLVGRLLSS